MFVRVCMSHVGGRDRPLPTLGPACSLLADRYAGGGASCEDDGWMDGWMECGDLWEVQLMMKKNEERKRIRGHNGG